MTAKDQHSYFPDRDSLKRYVQGKMSPEEAYRFEKRMLEDSFLQEAVEGMESLDGDRAEVDLAELSRRIKNRSTSHKKPPVYFYRVAAAIALLAVFSYIIYMTASRIDGVSKQEAVTQKLEKSGEALTNGNHAVDDKDVPPEDSQVKETGIKPVETDDLKQQEVAPVEGRELATPNLEGKEGVFSEDHEDLTPISDENKIVRAQDHEEDTPLQDRKEVAVVNDQEKADALAENLKVFVREEREDNTPPGDQEKVVLKKDREVAATLEEREKAVSLEGREEAATLEDRQEAVALEEREGKARKKEQEQVVLLRETKTAIPDKVTEKANETDIVSLGEPLNRPVTENFREPVSRSVPDTAVGQAGEAEVPGMETAGEKAVSGRAVTGQEEVPARVIAGEEAAPSRAVQGETTAKGPAIAVQEALHPEPFNGFDAYSQYIKDNLRYPASAVEKRIEGLVDLGFIINKDSIPSNLQVIRSLTGDCDTEAMRLLREGPKWKPVYVNGKLQEIEVYYTVPFKLED